MTIRGVTKRFFQNSPSFYTSEKSDYFFEPGIEILPGEKRYKITVSPRGKNFHHFTPEFKNTSNFWGRKFLSQIINSQTGWLSLWEQGSARDRIFSPRDSPPKLSPGIPRPANLSPGPSPRSRIFQFWVPVPVPNPGFSDFASRSRSQSRIFCGIPQIPAVPFVPLVPDFRS